MFRKIYNDLFTTKNNDFKTRVLTGAYLAPANPLKLLFIIYASKTIKAIDKLFASKNN